MTIRTHLPATTTHGGTPAPAPRARPHLALVGVGEPDEREAAARVASMAHHPAGNRARLATQQRAATMARHPAGGARHPLG